MLKGHVCIELHDTKTGFNDRIEGDNLITNALAEICKLVPESETNMNKFLPASTNAYGGLLLFDGQLDTDPDNFAFPTNVHLLGYGDRGVSTADSYKGSLNSVETGKTQTGYKNVWDFGTSQANGEIRSVALTHKDISSNLFYKDNQSEYLLRTWAPYGYSVASFGLPYDRVTQSWHDVHIELSSDYKKVTVNTCSRPMPMTKFRVDENRDVIGESTTIDILEHEYNSAINSYYTLLYIYSYPSSLFTLDIENSKAYIHYGVTRRILALWTIDLTDYTISYSELNLDFDTTDTYAMMQVLDGYLYIRWSSTKLRKINISNPALWTEIETDDVCLDCVLGGKALYTFHTTTSDSAYIGYSYIRYADGTTVRSLNKNYRSSNYGIKLIDPLIYQSTSLSNSSYANHLYLRRDYLGTKFNLPQTIVKNASQTMKVIYTLTDAE